MQRTITLHIEPDDRLVKTIEMTNLATNDILKAGFENKIVNKLKLHHLTYYPIREKYPNIPASIVTTARDNASEMLKLVKLRRLPFKRRWSAIRYNQRTFTPELGRGFVTLASINKRVNVPTKIPDYFKKYTDWKVVSAKLSYNGHKLVLGIVVEERTPSVRPPNTIIGVDTGILNHAVLSNDKFYRSSHIRKVKGEYQHIRRRLQAKGTRSAKRKLKRLSGREKRFMADVNHQIANWILSQPFDAVALEKLGIRRDKRLGRSFNRKLGDWAFGQLQRFIEYKAEGQGKAVIYIDARYTSQRCSRCGDIRKSNRTGLVYRCKACAFELHADLNAARNIASLGKAEAGRLSVNQPIVASSVSEHSVPPQLQAHESIRG